MWLAEIVTREIDEVLSGFITAGQNTQSFCDKLTSHS